MVDGVDVMMFHAEDDPYVPYQSVKKFAERTGVRLRLFRRGGHLSTDLIVRKNWPQIGEFFESCWFPFRSRAPLFFVREVQGPPSDGTLFGQTTLRRAHLAGYL